MKLELFVIILLSTIPGLLARSSGAPPEACSDLMPEHSVASQISNEGYFIISDAVGSYTPGQSYEVELRSESDQFRGFFIQARAERNQDSVSSIVGVWTPQDTTMARTARCNGVDGDAVTHSSNVFKRRQFFIWRAPETDVGRIHFIYSIAQVFSTVFVRLNATEERPDGAIAPPVQPPDDAIFPNNFSQPEGCDPDMCDVYVEWRNNGQFLDFRMEGDSIGWIALGISSVDTPLNMSGRAFSDILMCQVDSTMSTVVNVKDLFLPGADEAPMFDSNMNGTEFASGEIVDGRIFCNFSRVDFVLFGQEDQDIPFRGLNYLFFLVGDEVGTETDIPIDFNETISNVVFSSEQLDLQNALFGPVTFDALSTTLPGVGSFPTSSCDPNDCDFYFRWGINPNNSDYLVFYINADVSRGWAAIGVSSDRRMGSDDSGGNNIDDVFGCTATGPVTIPVSAIDTFNIAGGERQNIGDSESRGIVPHDSDLVNGRMTCTFSRQIPEQVGEDLSLSNSYYIMIGMGENGAAGNFPRHERNPQVSTSRINLVTDTSVDFDYHKIALIKSHGVFMIVAWPVLAYLGITMARHMKPAFPNGGWFLAHRILVISSLFFTNLAFLLIFVAFRNAPTRGLITLGELNESGTVHFALGITILALQISNPIIALFRCKPNADNRWIFNIFHGIVIGLGSQVLSSVNVCIGLYLFGEKYADPEEYAAFWVMLVFFIVFGLYDFAFSIYNTIAKMYNEDWVKPSEEEVEMKQVGAGDSGTSAGPPKKSPSPDYLLRLVSWVIMAVFAVIMAIVAIALVGSG